MAEDKNKKKEKTLEEQLQEFLGSISFGDISPEATAAAAVSPTTLAIPAAGIEAIGDINVKEQQVPTDLNELLSFAVLGPTGGALAPESLQQSVGGGARPAVREAGEAVGLDLPTQREIGERGQRAGDELAREQAALKKAKDEEELKDERRRRSAAFANRLTEARRRTSNLLSGSLGGQTTLGG